MRHVVLALALFGLLGLAGCGNSLDAESIENDARDGFEAAGVTVEDVSCPDEGDTGDTIECDVTVEGGDEVQLPYKVEEDEVVATDDTIKVITDYVAESGGGGGTETTPEE